MSPPLGTTTSQISHRLRLDGCVLAFVDPEHFRTRDQSVFHARPPPGSARHRTNHISLGKNIDCIHYPPHAHPRRRSVKVWCHCLYTCAGREEENAALNVGTARPAGLGAKWCQALCSPRKPNSAAAPERWECPPHEAQILSFYVVPLRLCATSSNRVPKHMIGQTIELDRVQSGRLAPMHSAPSLQAACQAVFERRHEGTT